MLLKIDFDKEKDLEFLREAAKHVLGRYLLLEQEAVELRILAAKAAQLQIILSEELLLLKKKIFDAKSERSKKRKIKTKKQKCKLVHNRPPLSLVEDEELELKSEEVIHSLSDETVEDAPELICDCHQGSLGPLSNCFEESSEIEVIEKQYIIRRHKRQKYKCKSCFKIVAAPGPKKLIPGSEFSTQIAVQVADDKYHRHLPLNRQADIMKENGLNVGTKTLYSLTCHLMALLSGLDLAILKEIKEQDHIHIDETRMPLIKENGNGYVWSVSNPCGVYYQYEMTRSQLVAKEILRSFDGIVVSDAYSGYEFLDHLENIIHALCLAHARRKFVDAQIVYPRSLEAVDIIDAVYKVEHKAENIEELKELRLLESTLLMKKLDNWINNQKGFYLESSLISKAINYFQNNKKGLTLFLNNPKIPIDNNAGERSMRDVVMGRKNFQGFRTINGADVGMFFYTIIGSCKLLKLSPKAYLTEISTRALNKDSLLTPFQFCQKIKNDSDIKKDLEKLKYSQ